MRYLNLLIVACFIALLWSCHKKADNTLTYNSINDVFSQLKLQPKTFTVDAGLGGSFRGNSGTRYVFAPNSMMFADGTAVTGPVQVQATEYLHKGDMLFSKMLPISNNEPLLSGGEISISVTQSGQEVFLKPGNAFTANIPGNYDTTVPMMLFSAENVPATDTGKFVVTWTARGPSMKNFTFKVDSVSLISDSFRMCNADAFLSSPNYQDFTVNIAVNGAVLPTTADVYACAFFDHYKAVWPLGLSGSASYASFHELHIPNIQVHFVAFVLIGGKFYGGITPAVPATGATYTVTLSQADAAVFRSSLNSL